MMKKIYILCACALGVAVADSSLYATEAGSVDSAHSSDNTDSSYPAAKQKVLSYLKSWGVSMTAHCATKRYPVLNVHVLPALFSAGWSNAVVDAVKNRSVRIKQFIDHYGVDVFVRLVVAYGIGQASNYASAYVYSYFV